MVTIIMTITITIITTISSIDTSLSPLLLSSHYHHHDGYCLHPHRHTNTITVTPPSPHCTFLFALPLSLPAEAVIAGGPSWAPQKAGMDAAGSHSLVSTLLHSPAHPCEETWQNVQGQSPQRLGSSLRLLGGRGP